MLIFGSGLGTSTTAKDAAFQAATSARRAFSGRAPKLALVFASLDYADAGDVPSVVRDVVGDIPIIGGSSGAGLIGPEEIATLGVSVVLLGGDDLEVAFEAVPLGSPTLVDVVPAAQRIAKVAEEAAGRGFGHHTCLVFAPGVVVDGDSLTAAVRKGVGAHTQLAGGLTGDELTFDRAKVFSRGELRDDHVLLAGLFTRKPVGIAARHGWRPVGPTRTVTRADGRVLFELDGRPALDVWMEDARRAGATLPDSRKDLTVYLATYYELGILDASRNEDAGGLVARAPWRIERDGSITLSSSIGEGSRVSVIHAGPNDLLRAASNAAAEASLRTGGPVGGALVIACSGRKIGLGTDFAREHALVRGRVGAPIGGVCAYGEIAKGARDVDAFFNMTLVVVTLPR